MAGDAQGEALIVTRRVVVVISSFRCREFWLHVMFVIISSCRLRIMIIDTLRSGGYAGEGVWERKSGIAGLRLANTSKMDGYDMLALAEAEEEGQRQQEPSPSPPPAPVAVPRKQQSKTMSRDELITLLQPLSQEQRAAVCHTITGGLQILAGPGSVRSRAKQQSRAFR